MMRRLVQKLAFLEKNPRRVFRALAALGGALLALDALLWVSGFYKEIPVWHGLYGFVMCVALVLGAKAMRHIVRRREDYYAPRATDSEEERQP